MSEKILNLEGIDPVELYGTNNAKIDKIKSFFPKLKIIIRGNDIKVAGADEDIEYFENKMNEIIFFLDKYNHLSVDNIDEILRTNGGSKLQDENIIIFGHSGKPIMAQTPTQQLMVKEYEENDLLFAIGPAGSGKTYTAIALAVKALKSREVKRIVLSRPAVEAGEKLGFLPGDLKEKLDPYLQALYDALRDMIPQKKLTDFLENGTIQIAPLAYMRGRTLDHAFVILDEAQNCTTNQLKMFLTRMGRNAKFIVTGDITQIDLPNKRMSGLLICRKILKGIKGISWLYFNENDIIRHHLVRKIVDAYENWQEEKDDIE